MGNSSSSSSKFEYDPSLDYKPSLDTRMISAPVSRRSSAHPTSRSSRRVRDDASISTRNNFLSPPSIGHRRSRSADPIIQDPPPPPYSRAEPVSPSTTQLATTSSGMGATAPGSRHTQVFSDIPPAAAASSRRAARTNSYLRAPMRRETAENALETLRKFDTVIIVDDSLSMAGSLWKEARDALASLADTAGEYDADGIDVYFLNDSQVGRDMKTGAAVQRLFNSVKPRGITPIAERLEELLLAYLPTIEAAKDTGDPAVLKAIKPINYIIITDGVPTDDPEDVIVNAARRLDARSFPVTQLGIQFVQIGSSKKATDYLNELDNGLSEMYGIRDIVDTTPYTGGKLTAEILTKILIGGINRRVDRKGAQAVMA